MAINVIISFVLAVVVVALSKGSSGLMAGFAVFCVGCFIAWLSQLVLAGFGELVKNSTIIANALNKNGLQPSTASDTVNGTSGPVCPHCGAELDGVDTKFCSRCGKEV